MATVVITISDNNKYKLTTDVEFQPPLTNDCTEAQAIAFRLLNLIGGRRVHADRSRLSIVHYPATDLSQSAPAFSIKDR